MNDSKSMTKDPICGMTVDQATALHAERDGETSFVQVLVARRTYFDTNLQYIVSQAQLAQAKALVDGYVLTGALDPVTDNTGNDGLRGLTFSQQ